MPDELDKGLESLLQRICSNASPNGRSEIENGPVTELNELQRLGYINNFDQAITPKNYTVLNLTYKGMHYFK